jgi:hypothetical protein
VWNGGASSAARRAYAWRVWLDLWVAISPKTSHSSAGLSRELKLITTGRLRPNGTAGVERGANRFDCNGFFKVQQLFCPSKRCKKKYPTVHL